MDDKEKLRIVESVLNNVAGRDGAYPDGDIADEIIATIRNLTGDETFCSNVQSLEAITSNFELRIATWENDADNYSTQVTTNLTKADVEFYLALARLFKSRNSRPDPGMGNDEIDFEFLVETIDELLEEHPNTSHEVNQIWRSKVSRYAPPDERDGDEVYEDLCQYVLGDPVEYEHGFCRVFDSFKVFAVQDGKRVEVTEQFK